MTKGRESLFSTSRCAGFIQGMTVGSAVGNLSSVIYMSLVIICHLYYEDLKVLANEISVRYRGKRQFDSNRRIDDSAVLEFKSWEKGALPGMFLGCLTGPVFVNIFFSFIVVYIIGADVLIELLSFFVKVITGMMLTNNTNVDIEEVEEIEENETLAVEEVKTLSIDLQKKSAEDSESDNLESDSDEDSRKSRKGKKKKKSSSGTGTIGHKEAIAMLTVGKGVLDRALTTQNTKTRKKKQSFMI